ncbi:cyclic pyranopterin phosphate synthase [Deinobacterium chartae]|uniref:Cyclic pyranopterin monophosphate synthase n=1 Tax=Deinobacterium chartae TaxID=521158 RepID=A0A841I7A0_9DEIO|nr:cyclic pyranopterin monophosphate synthase MoaC [Deinobacterium chartae]MBB6100089.1 cyclic pyranopterin phosphate synthase [Deinobacterium chartae]
MSEPPSPLTHFQGGRPRMVDISSKDITLRTARAEAHILLPETARAALEAGTLKGDPLAVAQLAGIMAAKRTGELIPLCHPLPLRGVEVLLEAVPEGLRCEARVRTEGPTGVEMEALTAVTVAALTVYDMLKSASKGIEIARVRLLEKTGGKSGDWYAPDLNAP